MAGGVGSRFWPMSTAEKPKQFIDVLGVGKTLLQLTVERFDTLVSPENIWVVTNEKYAETRWGIFRLRFFFSDRYDNDGDEVSTRKVKSALRDIIDHEDKKQPFTDAQLEEEMRRRGFQTKRRTIVKYREQMNIPKSSLRRQ